LNAKQVDGLLRPLIRKRVAEAVLVEAAFGVVAMLHG